MKFDTATSFRYEVATVSCSILANGAQARVASRRDETYI